MKRFIIVILILINSSLFSLDKPVIAVPTIGGIEVPPFLAEVCRDLIESALIKTNKFSVINYTNIEEILAAQSFSLSGCVDDSCAVEIGKLLAAESIIVGTLSKVGEKMLLSIRLVGVSTGKGIRAEVITIDSVDDLQKKCFVAAYNLAGLKYISGSDSPITEKGSLYVEAPEGMSLEISLDGVYIGSTPQLIENISYGVHLLEASTNNYLYKNEINIDNRDLIEVVADNNTLKGNLYIKIIPASADNYNLFLDQDLYSAGLIKDLSIGRKSLKIVSSNWIYEGSVEVISGETQQLEIELNPAGTLDMDPPFNSIIRVKSKNGTVLNVDNFPVLLETGKYYLSVENTDYITYNTEIFIEQGKVVALTPDFIHSKEFIEKQKLNNLEKDLNLLFSDRNVILHKRANMTKAAWITASVGLLGLTAAAISEYYLPDNINDLDQLYSSYLDETDPTLAWNLWNQIDDHKSKIDLFRLIRTAGIITACVAGTVDIGLLLFKPSTEAIDYKIGLLKGSVE